MVTDSDTASSAFAACEPTIKTEATSSGAAIAPMLPPIRVVIRLDPIMPMITHGTLIIGVQIPPKELGNNGLFVNQKTKY
jgi:hypothetical protein